MPTIDIKAVKVEAITTNGAGVRVYIEQQDQNGQWVRAEHLPPFHLTDAGSTVESSVGRTQRLVVESA